MPPVRRDWIDATPGGPPRRAHRSVGQLARAMRSLLRGHGWLVAGALSTLTLATGLALISPLATKVAFDYIILDAPGPSGIPAWLGLPTDRVTLLWLLGGAMVVISAVGLVVGMVGRYQMTRLTKLVQARMRRRVFGHLARLPLHRLSALKSGGISGILREDAGVVGEMLFSVLYNPWRAVLTFAGGLTAMAVLDWRMLVGGLLAGPVVYVSHRTWITRIRPVFRDMKQTRTAADAHAAEVFGGVRVVRTFGRARGEAGRQARRNHLIARQEMLVWWWSRIIEGVWSILIPGASAAVLVYGGSRVISGNLSIGDVAAFTAYLLMLLGPMEVLVSTAANLQNNLAGFDRCLDLLEEPTEDDLAARAALAAAQGGGDGGVVRGVPWGVIRFEGVSFAYPGHEARVLQGINLEIGEGETVALVGASGSGKTTLCNLVARFFDPTEGRITMSGVDLRRVDLAAYRRGLGIVEQEVFLFDGTVAENIGYARAGAGRGEIEAAARAANAAEFVERLEHGYDTVIGERGVRLSGGQKQRLAIARALLADPRVLILDEATSSLDSHSESLIQRSLRGLMEGRTCLVIAHRLGTIRHASRIVVLERGRIAEVGNHEELVAKEGLYYEMLQVQLHTGRDYAA